MVGCLLATTGAPVGAAEPEEGTFRLTITSDDTIAEALGWAVASDPSVAAPVERLLSHVRARLRTADGRAQLISAARAIASPKLTIEELSRQVDLLERVIDAERDRRGSGYRIAVTDAAASATEGVGSAHGRRRGGRNAPDSASGSWETLSFAKDLDALTCSSKGCTVDHRLHFTGTMESRLNYWRRDVTSISGDAAWYLVSFGISCTFASSRVSNYGCGSDGTSGAGTHGRSSWRGWEGGPWSSANGFTGTKTYHLNYDGRFPGYPAPTPSPDQAAAGCYHNSAARADGCWF